jgi:hypothetical protein
VSESHIRAKSDKEKLAQILFLVKVNIENVMALDAALSTANDEIGRLNAACPPKKAWYGAHCYTVIHYGLAMSLALILARLFDEGSPRFPLDQRDVASLPLLVHLLGKPSMRAQLMEDARSWPVDGSQRVIDKIHDAIGQWKQLAESESGKTALNALKDFRNKRLAHTLNKPMDTAGPRYLDLITLRDTALRIASDARFAIEGVSWEPFDFLEERIRQGRAFWRPAIAGVIASE